MSTMRRPATTTLVGIVVVLSTILTGLTGVAAAMTNGWVFTGSLASPTRDSDGRVAISGRLTVPACADQQRGCWLAVHREESGVNAGWQEVSTNGTRLVFRTAGVYNISGWAFLTEGTWELGVVAGIDSQGRAQGGIVASGLTASVTVPGVRSTRVVTQASAPSVVQGEALTITLAEEVSWTDGVVTFRSKEGFKELAWRPTGAALWDRVDEGSDEFLVSPTGPGDYRMVVDGRAAEPVFVNVIRPTNAHRIGDPSVSARAAIANSIVSITSAMETQYDDKLWRPSPPGTRYELQYLADGSQAWARLLSSSIREPGRVEFRFKMLTTGRFRIAAGEATGLSVLIEEIVPVAVPAIEPLALPTAVAPGEPVDVNVGVEVEYSDGEIRDVPDGTDYIIQFSPSPSRSASGEKSIRAKVRWKVMKKGKIRDGQVMTQIRPRTSGYWRIRVGEAATPRVLVTVQRRN